MNWVQKISKPINLNKELQDISDEVVSRIISLKSIPNNKSFEILNTTYNNKGKEIVLSFWINQVNSPNETLPRISASTPFMRYETETSNICYINLFSNIPVLTDKEVLRILILHELVHCIDPKLNNENLRKKRWHMNKTKEMYEPGYFQSNKYFLSPWEVDADISSQSKNLILDLYQSGIPQKAALNVIRNIQPKTDLEKLWKDNGYWKKYIKALYFYFKQIYNS